MKDDKASETPRTDAVDATQATAIEQLQARVRELELAMKVIGPPDGKVDMVELLSQLANADLLRTALVKVREQRDQAEARVAKYNELLHAVGNKYPNESRHETALRYIREREQMSIHIGETDAARRKEST